jgi:hypothetical protein
MTGSVVEKLSSAAEPRVVPDKIAQKLLVFIFSSYVILLAITVYNHEPWMDEAQAWLLAKDVSVYELFTKYLRYEGSPGLWHLILMIPAKAGLPYFSINIISAFFSVVGVALFLRYAPMPLWVKVLFPFTYFTFFQYGVVARNYCLVPCLLFLAAICYHGRMKKPFQYIFVLCLLANISAHTFLIAASFVFLHFLEVVSKWKTLSSSLRTKQLAAFALFGAMVTAIVVMLLPPADHIFANLANSSSHKTLDVVLTMLGGSLVVDEFSKIKPLESWLALLVFAVTIVWFTKRKVAFLYLLPLLLILTLFALKYRNYWHEGILFYLWLTVLWISFKNNKKDISRLPATMLSIIGVVFFIQVYWAVTSINYDWHAKYSASKSLANYIKANELQDKKIFVSGWKCVSVLPYFDRKIFYNYNEGSEKRFWWWSKNNMTPVGAGKIVLNSVVYDQPDLVVFASHYIPRQKRIRIAGYDVVGTFKGFLCWKTGVLEPESYLVFKKSDGSIDPIIQPKHNYLMPKKGRHRK